MTRLPLFLLASLLLVPLHAVADTINACVKQSKRKLRVVADPAEYCACRLKAESKAIKKGEVPDFAKCDSKYGEKWAKAESKAGGACPTEGDEAAIQAKIIGDADTIVAKLSGVRFEDPNDGTVIDNQTGLMWEKKISGSGCLHCLGDTYTWTEAMSEWISEVNGQTDDENAQAGLGGHTDWRLPTIVELQTILLAPFPCGTSPCIDPIFGPTATSAYWSSSTYAIGSGFAWDVNFGMGFAVVIGKFNGIHVRAVRGGL